MSKHRVVVRLAWRELRARPWRTLLVAFLVAIPITGMVVATVLVRTPRDDGQFRLTNAELFVWDRGDATGRVVPVDVDTLLPGARGVHIREGYMRLRASGDVRTEVELRVGDLADPLVGGDLTLLSGRLPTRAGEVALSPSARERLHVEVGDTLELERPELTLEVVGSAVRTFGYNARIAVFAELPARFSGALFGGITHVDLPGDPTQLEIDTAIADLTEAGFGASEPGEERVYVDDDQDDVNWTYVIGSLVLLVVGIVIAAAFAIGARRQLHTLGMLAGNGAEPGDLRSMLLVEGALCGAAGVVLGFALSGALLVAAAPHRNRMVDQVVTGWRVLPGDLVPIALIGVAAATIAAAQPARSASRVSVLQAIAGQRPSGPVPAWLPTLGVVTFGSGLGLLALAVLGSAGDDGSGGTVWTFTAILGGVCVLLGTTACAPAIVGRLEPVAGRLRGTWRLSARSLARQRSRSSGIVAAIAAAGALAVGGSALVLSSAADEDDVVQQLPDDVVAVGGGFDVRSEGTQSGAEESSVERVLEIIGPAERAEYRPLVDVGVSSVANGVALFQNLSIAVADDSLVAFLDLDDEARAALADGTTIIIDSAVDEGTHPIQLQRFPMRDDVVATELPTERTEALVVERDEPLTWSMPNVLVPERVVEALDAEVAGTRVLLRADHELDDDERNALRDLDEDIADESGSYQPGFFGGGISWNERSETPVLLIQTILAAVALGFTLLVVAIGLGLAAAEGRSERDVLVAVGAPPRTLSRLAGTKAAVLAVVGAVLALPTAMLPVWVWTRASSPDEALVMPWVVVGLLVIGVPAVAGLATSLCSAIGARVRPVQASGFLSE